LGYIIVFGAVPFFVLFFLLIRYVYRNWQTIIVYFRRRPQILGAPPSSPAIVIDLSSGSAPF
jgi:hypothetical protein